MKKTQAVLIGMFVVVLTFFSISMSYAKDGGHGHKYGLEEKVFKKMHLALKNQEQLGLSDEQYDKIKTLKINTKKDLIKRHAEIDLIGVDIKSKLWDETIDVKGINKLIDEKYNLKKEKAKALIAVYAQLKTILSKEQKEKFKKLMQYRDKMQCKK